MDENTKKLKKMATWTIAIFATIFAVTFAVLFMMSYPLNSSALATIGSVFSQGWLILVLDIVLCGGAFFGYKAYLNAKK